MHHCRRLEPRRPCMHMLGSNHILIRHIQKWSPYRHTTADAKLLLPLALSRCPPPARPPCVPLYPSRHQARLTAPTSSPSGNHVTQLHAARVDLHHAEDDG